jgi:hypothetical protein
MISDPKSAHFISWNDLGTSFVVSNVGEFSRNILGSHFKHNNVRLIFFRFIFFYLFLFYAMNANFSLHIVLEFRATVEYVWLP